VWCGARPHLPHRGNSLSEGSPAAMGSCLSLYSDEVFHHHSTVMIESCSRVRLEQPPCHVPTGVTQWNGSDPPPRFTLPLFTVKMRSYPGCGARPDPIPLTGVTP
jgi:hypothetical protein